MAGVRVRIKRIKPDPKTKQLDLRALMKREQLKEARLVKKDYESTVKTWTAKPDFTVSETRFGADVFTRSDRYLWIDKGTRKRDIVPRRAKVLVFKPHGYKPKTAPRGKQLAARAGSPGGAPLVFTKRVRGHKITARRFSKRIQKKSQARIARNFDKALARMVRSQA